MHAAMVRSWVEGWIVSRGAAPLVEEGWGYTVEVGVPGQVRRHVLPEADEPLIRKLTGSITARHTWLKTFVEPEVIRPWLSPGWVFDSPGFLMSAPLRRGAVDVPDGYRLRRWTRCGVTRVVVVASDGAFAARGQIAVRRGCVEAVVDQVETAPEHRRRGLGGVVIRTLASAAAESGAVVGVLGATVEGRALYESLGWSCHAPLTGVIFDPGAA
ncbi:GNAT family N-acetyltransferase [Streptomyces orinoci]|uniref:GNAT family N-acetyltransferase n=1 Tax=Streptomyces orinoci TaxID=67339 RepID=A0ABV3JYZ2_STRON|nr:GNAT family N-acetyltransferase [Streptomyces orinoci]